MAATPTVVPQNEQRNVIYFSTVENVSGSEIHTRLRVVYGEQNVITKLIGIDGYRAVGCRKEGPSVGCHRHQQTHRSIRKMSR